MSTCLNGDADSGEKRSESKKTPTVFVKGALAKNWKLRCKWWLNRHFNKKLLASEITRGMFFYSFMSTSWFNGFMMDNPFSFFGTIKKLVLS